ncbi:hypothetical protein CK203_060584 [Vitis vinifera]|uniref:Copia protein n=1 Tax=Vitis vinifera TaxID=29760 RepID=A0A438FTU3_VITVI|nr:hypothetical protein CK203_060584 [Vitis vinifera]
MNLLCDNKAAIDIAHNPIQHDRTKHVEVDRHFIKQNLEAKIIQFPFDKSEDQLADILTKAMCSISEGFGSLQSLHSTRSTFLRFSLLLPPKIRILTTGFPFFMIKLELMPLKTLGALESSSSQDFTLQDLSFKQLLILGRAVGLVRSKNIQQMG